MKKQLLTAVTAITVIFAGLITAGCAGNSPTAKVSGENDTVQATKEYVADLYADGTEGMTEIIEASVTEPEVVSNPEAQTEKGTAEGQTLPDETQTDKNGEEGGEQQTKPTAPPMVKPSAPAQPETQAPEKAPASSTVKPSAPAQPETQAPAKVPAQPTVKPSAPAQPETQAPTKAPAQPTVKPSAPAQPETQAPTKAPAQPTVKPSAPAQPETQAPTKAPEPPKEKTMWDAPYDVEGIRAYIANELIARGYTDLDDFDAYKKRIKELWNADTSEEEWEYVRKITPFGEDFGAWSSETTATAGTPRYYDNTNNCTVGHLHYNWAEPHTGGGALRNDDGRLTLQTMVDDAIDFWDGIYGKGGSTSEGYGSDFFKIYIEKFEDGCVIFYIIM